MCDFVQASWLFPRDNLFNPPGPLRPEPQFPDLPSPWRLSAPRFAHQFHRYLCDENPPATRTNLRPLLLQGIRNRARECPIFSKIHEYGLSLLDSSAPCPPLSTAFEAMSTLFDYCPIQLPFLQYPVPFHRLTIGRLTAIHFQFPSSRPQDFKARLDLFIDLAFVHSHPRPSDNALAIIRSQFQTSWRRLSTLKWDNHVLSLYWRFVLRGISTHDQRASWTPPAPLYCVCSDPPCTRPRDHTFWTCPIAAAVRSALTDLLRSIGVFTPFTQYHLWLLISPDPQRMPPYFWSVLCCITIASMELGRKLVALRTLNKSQLSVPEISAAARSKFHSLLTDFRLFARIPGRKRRLLNDHTFDTIFPAYGPSTDEPWPDPDPDLNPAPD